MLLTPHMIKFYELFTNNNSEIKTFRKNILFLMFLWIIELKIDRLAEFDRYKIFFLATEKKLLGIKKKWINKAIRIKNVTQLHIWDNLKDRLGSIKESWTKENFRFYQSQSHLPKKRLKHPISKKIELKLLSISKS